MSAIYPCPQCLKIIPGLTAPTVLHLRFTPPPAPVMVPNLDELMLESAFQAPNYLACIFISCLCFKNTVTIVDHNTNWELFWFWLVYTNFFFNTYHTQIRNLTCILLAKELFCYRLLLLHIYQLNYLYEIKTIAVLVWYFTSSIPEVRAHTHSPPPASHLQQYENNPFEVFHSLSIWILPDSVLVIFILRF